MFGLITTRRHRAELAAARAASDLLRTERDRLISERNAFRLAAATAARQFAEADATNTRLAGRNKELQERARARAVVAQQRGTALGKLGNRLSNVEDDFNHIDGYAARLEERLDRALKATARALAAYWAETRRANQLQERLDDAVGLHHGGHVVDSRRWQPGYVEPKPGVSA